jgi:hypothetical protein
MPLSSTFSFRHSRFTVHHRSPFGVFGLDDGFLPAPPRLQVLAGASSAAGASGSRVVVDCLEYIYSPEVPILLEGERPSTFNPKP